MTEKEHLSLVNRQLLALGYASSRLSGAYCLAFSTFAFHAGYPVTAAQMDELADCRSITKGIELTRQFWGEDFFECAWKRAENDLKLRKLRFPSTVSNTRC
jgi:hypothetical protein